MYYIDQFKTKANQAIRTRAGKVILSLDETTGLLDEIAKLSESLEEARSASVVPEAAPAETIYVDVAGGSFK